MPEKSGNAKRGREFTTWAGGAILNDRARLRTGSSKKSRARSVLAQ
jgi:hypothetical protein